jgi:hypothetical protein
VKNAVLWDVTPCGSLRTNVSEESIASIISVARIGELGTTLAITNNRSTAVKTSNLTQSLPYSWIQIYGLFLAPSSNPRGKISHQYHRFGVVKMVPFRRNQLRSHSLCGRINIRGFVCILSSLILFRNSTPSKCGRICLRNVRTLY